MKFPFEILSEDPRMTEEIGKMLAADMKNNSLLPRFVAMYGDLGVGKTAFVRGFCEDLCPSYTVKSPTFSLVNEYKCPKDAGIIKKVFHFDMYRIIDEDDLYSIGFYDYLRPDAVCIAEWCEMIPYALPESYIKVEIGKVDLSDKRNISISIIGV